MAERENEVLSTAGLDAAERSHARKRRDLILGSQEEKNVALWAPNADRNCVDNPAVFESDDD